MKFAPIQCIPGTNYRRESNVIRTPEDPSGLKAVLSTHHIEMLCQLGREEYQTVMNAAYKHCPDIIDVLSIPSAIEFYAMSDSLPAQAKAMMLPHSSILKVSGIGGPKPTGVLHVPETISNTIMMRLTAEDFDAKNIRQLRAIIGHEICHLLMQNGVCGNMVSRLEALTDPVEKTIYGNEHAGHIFADPQKYNWDPKSVQCTDGFAEPDFSKTSYSPVVRKAMYLIAPLAFQGIAPEKIWKVWLQLLAHAKQTKLYPVGRQIRNVIAHELQEDSEQVLTNPAFVPMQKEGISVVALQAKDNRCAIAMPVLKKKNPHFGLNSIKQYTIDCFTVAESSHTVPYNHFLSRPTGKYLQGEGLLGEMQQFSFGMFEKYLPIVESDKAPKILDRIQREHITEMIYEIPGLNPIKVVRSEYDPWKE